MATVTPRERNKLKVYLFAGASLVDQEKGARAFGFKYFDRLGASSDEDRAGREARRKLSKPRGPARRRAAPLGRESSVARSTREGLLLLLQGERFRRGSVAIVLLQSNVNRRRGAGNIEAFGTVANDKFVCAISQGYRHPLLVCPSCIGP
jgi:hypothetical protein